MTQIVNKDCTPGGQLWNESMLEGRPWLEAADFPLGDPWSEFTRGVIRQTALEGGFRGDVFEAGVGDGRNVVAANLDQTQREQDMLIGLDVDAWRLDVAGRNLSTLALPGTVELVGGDAVAYLAQRSERLRGWGVACLPQAPQGETLNHADGFDANLESLRAVAGLELGGRPVDDYGLTLNAAYLEALRGRTAPGEFTTLITLSDRIPQHIRHELFGRLGWQLLHEQQTPQPIRQDVDTGVAYVAGYDDGQRFYRRDDKGLYTPISADEAEARRLHSAATSEPFNVHHHVSVSTIAPKEGALYA